MECPPCPLCPPPPKHPCDVGGIWADNSVGQIGMATDKANACVGAHVGGAW